VQECEQACYEVGRDPKTLRRTWFGPCICSTTETKVRELNAKHISTDQGFIGTPGQVIEQMQQFIDLGVNNFMFNMKLYDSKDTLFYVHFAEFSTRHTASHLKMLFPSFSNDKMRWNPTEHTTNIRNYKIIGTFTVTAQV
jgi:hypothetical protein